MPLISRRTLKVLFLGLGIFSVLTTATSLRAAETAAATPPSTESKANNDGPLVIANGAFSRNGQMVKATVRNLVDAITKRYPDVNINVVGVENVVIENLTLQWRRIVSNDFLKGNPPLQSVLAAVSAASDHQVQWSAYSDHDFLLSSNERSRTSQSIAEVFNLGRILAGPKTDPNLDVTIRNSETEYKVLSNRYGPEAPRMKDISERLEVLKTLRAQQDTRSPADDNKRIDQIREVVYLTLEQLKPSGAKLPQFEFHRGTNLLIVIGNEDAIDVTRKVVAAFEKNLN